MKNEESNIHCGQCGEPLPDKLGSEDPQHITPCPKCGSTARAVTAHLHIAVTTSATAQGQIITYPQMLLEIAKSLIDQNYFSIAVIVSHMACEVATERILSQSFASKNIQNLEEPVTEFLNGYNLANDKIRKFYIALTGDEIEEQQFWQNFKKSAKRRNQIMHRGAIVGKTEAEESLKAASAFVTHLLRG